MRIIPTRRYLDEHVPTEFGTLQARDGQTLYYEIMKPRNLVPGRRYPVIVDVYGGPEAQDVRRAWDNSTRSKDGFFHQFLVQQGYIVFALDNRGTGYRGVQFETALYHRMGSVEVEDQVAGVEFLRSLPYVDGKRIGIFGWSYGGYMALMCAMQAPDSFAAAVAGAPVTDWRLYDTHYTERYMGTPQENAEGYACEQRADACRGLARPAARHARHGRRQRALHEQHGALQEAARIWASRSRSWCTRAASTGSCATRARACTAIAW